MKIANGLDDVVVAQTKITSIENGILSYSGYLIDDLVQYAGFEEVIYLLWYKELPSKAVLKSFKEKIFSHMNLSDDFLSLLAQIRIEKTHPMDFLRTAVSLLSIYEPIDEQSTKDDQLTVVVRLQANIAVIVAAFSRFRENLPLVKPKPIFNYAENFLYMLSGETPDQIDVEAFNKSLILHADHEFNASTFTARVCVATLADLYAGLTAAISSLKGPLHGGANEQVIQMLMEIKEPHLAIDYVKRKMENKEKIMGMGHRVYKNGDVRAHYLKELSKRLTEVKNMRIWYDMSVEIADYVKTEKGLHPNVDFYSASLYHALNIPHDLFTPVFAMSRTSGWLAHMLEQYDNNRLIRPRAQYVGKQMQTYVPLEAR